MMFSLAPRSLLLTLVLTTYMLLVRGNQRICPIPQCNDCLDRSQQSAPGIGFHLGLTTGTVAVSHNDGHFEDVVSIPGSPEYIALMQDITTQPTRLDLPSLESAADRIHYMWTALKRRANLLLGRPGTPIAATLSAMLSSLRSESQSHLSGSSVANVGIAFANAALVSRDEINDALTYAGLRPLGERQVYDQELNAAYGAYGFGLCPSYRDPYKCEEEEEDTFGLGDLVLHLDSTSKTLAANTAELSTARETYANTRFVSWELGRDEASQKWATEDDYWTAVGAALRNLTAIERKRPYSQLLLTGDRIADEKFLEVMRDALQGSGIADQARTSQQQADFTFVVARGAAEFQRRRQQGWLNCVQPKHCSQSLVGEDAGSRETEQVPEL